MRLSDRTTGLVLAAVGALAAYGGSRLPPVPGQQVGPSVFPMVVGVGLVLCGLLVALGIGSRFEEPDPQPATGPAGGGGRPAPLGGLRVLVPPALLLFYVLASDRLGFLITAALIVLATALTLGARLRLAIPLALAAPVGVHLVFAKLLRVALPPGLLPAPW
ncbi:MAG TPA: tripartite tricarboxylate transporter TctB family protein [Salinarimonas sp.]|nr:tripartite tricarboxylate transporter TctB family protein [Salinarimonas sp.]